MNTFLKLETLGILSSRLDEACYGQTKRARQQALRSCYLLLKELRIIPELKPPIAVARGVNSLGEPGYWIVQESVHFNSAEEAGKTVHANVQGPVRHSDHPSRDCPGYDPVTDSMLGEHCKHCKARASEHFSQERK